jgi:hypothetical protein
MGSATAELFHPKVFVTLFLLQMQQYYNYYLTN